MAVQEILIVHVLAYNDPLEIMVVDSFNQGLHQLRGDFGSCAQVNTGQEL